MNDTIAIATRVAGMTSDAEKRRILRPDGDVVVPQDCTVPPAMKIQSGPETPASRPLSIALAPSYSCAHEDRAIFLALTGRRAEALAEITKINQLDYGFSAAHTESRVYYELLDYPNLIEASPRGLLLDPNDWFQHYMLGVGYEATGRLEEAISEYQKAMEISADPQSVVALAHAYSAVGKKSQAEKMLRDLERKSKATSASPYTMATIYAGLGETDTAFKFLEESYSQKSLESPSLLRSDLVLDSLRPDPRFQNLLRRVGWNN